jgi:hypothetical protein
MSLQDNLEFVIILLTFFCRITTFLTPGELPPKIMPYLMKECTLAKHINLKASDETVSFIFLNAKHVKEIFFLRYSICCFHVSASSMIKPKNCVSVAFVKLICPWLT